MSEVISYLFVLLINGENTFIRKITSLITFILLIVSCTIDNCPVSWFLYIINKIYCVYLIEVDFNKLYSLQLFRKSLAIYFLNSNF